ncbi:uncharacterized protein LOC125179425 [Hyalella azteca]|uniref:Uncharacterized protein LOC125179425 n=1 Tax=Hyalella azteca TaxID=294128 RepID=A0A979FXH8_HYAAZ|nr:uncharacterized protein LOC125179425 [Hyalella azteca]
MNEELTETEVCPVRNLDGVLTRLGTGLWNYKIWGICATIYCLMPANMFYGAFVAPAVNHTCAPPPGCVAADQCTYYASGTNGSTLPCTHWLYDNSTFKFTLTEQFDLVCGSAHMRALVSSVYMMGSAAGAPVGGLLSDKFQVREEESRTAVDDNVVDDNVVDDNVVDDNVSTGSGGRESYCC